MWFSEAEEGELVCVHVRPVTENETQAVHEEVKQLQILSLAIKEKKKIKTKVTVGLLLISL